MNMYRLCPNCGWKNPPDELFCVQCMVDISDVPIVDQKSPDNSIVQDTAEKEEKIELSLETTVESSFLVLRGPGFELRVSNGAIVGRLKRGKEFLGEYTTVSRQHARFFKRDGQWYVEDLNSTNGTYVNGFKIDREHPIKLGDVISLSNALNLTVEEMT